MKLQYRIAKIMLVLILIFTSIFITSPFVSADSDNFFREQPDTAAISDAALYAKDLGVTLDEAINRFYLMDIAGCLHAELKIDETETFGESWLEHKPALKMVCQFTRDGEKTIAPYLEKYPELAGIIEIRTAKISYQELTADQTKVIQALENAGIPTDTDLDIYQGRVKIFVAERMLLDEAISSKKLVLPDNVEIITVEKVGVQLCSLIGGHNISGSGYMATTGFTAVDSYGQRYVTTAGHVAYDVGPTAYYDFNYELTRVDYSAFPPLDFGYYASTETKTNVIKVSNTTRSITSIRNLNQLQVGDSVFKYGLTTGVTWGVIVSLNYDGGYIRIENPYQTDPLALYGDSGAPAFRDNAAIGIVLGRSYTPPANNMLMSSVSYMPVYYGVTVLTTP